MFTSICEARSLIEHDKVIAQVIESFVPKKDAEVLTLEGRRKISKFRTHDNGLPLVEDQLDLLTPEILYEAVNIRLLMGRYRDIVLIFSKAFD